MSVDRPEDGLFRAELSALIARAKHSAGCDVREDLYKALSSLERKALVGGASDALLCEIAEVRFLTGILREAMRPAGTGGLRNLLRARDALRPAPRCETRRRLEACRDQA